MRDALSKSRFGKPPYNYNYAIKQDILTAEQLEEIKQEELRLQQIEQEFNITGVNQLKTQLESNIEILTQKCKALERKIHYAQIQEKRLEKAHTKEAIFVHYEEKDKGMEVLKQLEFMKKKIDGINRGLRTNFEMRKHQKIQVKEMQRRVQESQAELNELPQAQLTQPEIDTKAAELLSQINKWKTQKIVRERTLNMQIANNERLIKEYRGGIKSVW